MDSTCTPLSVAKAALRRGLFSVRALALAYLLTDLEFMAASAERKANANADDQIVETTVVLRDGLNRFRGTRDVAISIDPRISSDNHGAGEHIWIHQASGVSLLKFDFDYSVIPEDAIVKEARLELSVVSIGFSKAEISVPSSTRTAMGCVALAFPSKLIS